MMWDAKMKSFLSSGCIIKIIGLASQYTPELNPKNKLVHLHIVRLRRRGLRLLVHIRT